MSNKKNISTRLIHKHDIEANWEKATGFIPMQGEIICYDVDENYTYERIKIGDGIQDVNALPFLSSLDDNVKPDYAQNDPAAPDYIKNRLAYTETKALTYDGNHDNRIPLRDGVYAAHVADELIDLNDITKIVLTPENGNPITFEATSENV